MLAQSAPQWNALSRKRIDEFIDWMVVELDPEARRQARERDEDRCVHITPDQHGMADLSGRLPAAGAATLNTRLDAIAAGVCPDDPRTRDHRRADALIALPEGATTLACQCGRQGCPNTDAGTPSQVVIHVIAEHATVDGDGTTPGYLPGYGPIHAETVRDLAGTDAVKVTPLIVPAEAAPEPRYRPSAALAEFIDFRDLSCRWPGCGVPAERCDTDHTVPWPHGPTHPSNLKLYCRHHHIVKTFWFDRLGWTETQDPDGTPTIRTPGRS